MEKLILNLIKILMIDLGPFSYLRSPSYKPEYFRNEIWFSEKLKEKVQWS